MQLSAEKGDFSNKKRPKRDPKSGLGLLRDPGLPKRDPVGSSDTDTNVWTWCSHTGRPKSSSRQWDQASRM